MLPSRDGRILTKEFLVVAWRLNPVGIAAYLFIEACNSLNEYTEDSHRAVIIGDVIQSIELPKLTQHVNDVKGIAGVFFDESIEGMLRLPLEVYPDLADRISERIKPKAKDMTPLFESLIEEAIYKHQLSYDSLNRHFHQLCEFFPRYSSLMNRSTVIDLITAFTAGFFGGQAGVAGVHIWEDWKNTSDGDFLSKFGAAIDNFVQNCSEFQQGAENSLSSVFDRLLDEVEEIENILFQIYRELEVSGRELKPLYEKHREIPKELDEDSKQIFLIVISNLSENTAISNRQLTNMRQMLRM